MLPYFAEETMAPLTSRNRRSENVLVEPIIVLKLTLRNVERHTVAANLVIAADKAAPSPG